MNLSEALERTVSEAVRTGVRAGLVNGANAISRDAEQAILNWEQAIEEAHHAAGDLAAFEAKRPMIERQALEALMKEEADPITGKALSLTRAKELLDTVPEYRKYRSERNEKEGVRHFLLAKAQVAERRADLAIAMLNATGRSL